MLRVLMSVGDSVVRGVGIMAHSMMGSLVIFLIKHLSMVILFMRCIVTMSFMLFISQSMGNYGVSLFRSNFWGCSRLSIWLFLTGLEMFLVVIFVLVIVMVKVSILVRVMSASILCLESIWVLNVVIRFTVAVMRVIMFVVCMRLMMAVQIVRSVMGSVPYLLLMIVVFASRVVTDRLVTMLLSNELLIRQERLLI